MIIEPLSSFEAILKYLVCIIIYFFVLHVQLSGIPFQQFGRCPPLQTHQVVCPILVLLLGLGYPQGPFWALVLDQTRPRVLFTA